MMPVVDSDVLIAHLRGVKPAHEWLRATFLDGRPIISVITVAEVIGGMTSPERFEVQSLLATFKIEPITEKVAHTAGELRRQYRRSHNGIGLGDYLIAATAIELQTLPATLNIKDYLMFPGLRRPFELPGPE